MQLQKVFCRSILVAVVGCYAIPSSAEEALARDPSLPIVYIEFDHAGPRAPVEEGEPSVGLWLRLVNNSRVPIVVRANGTATGDDITLLQDVVTPIWRRIPSSGISGEKMPSGYALDTSTQLTVVPGQYVLFSVPANHVSRDWYMQVPWRFKLPPVKRGSQPVCFSTFTWEDIPADTLQRLR